jgi:hypothetical protein
MLRREPGAINSMQNAESSHTAPNLGQANVAAGGSATTTGEMRSVGGELQGKLDSKSARVGETVMVKPLKRFAWQTAL